MNVSFTQSLYSIGRFCRLFLKATIHSINFSLLPRHRWEDNIEIDLHEDGGGHGLYCSGSGYGQVAGSCECGNELYIKPMKCTFTINFNSNIHLFLTYVLKLIVKVHFIGLIYSKVKMHGEGHINCVNAQ
jgi:hypothetical protein